MPGLFRPSYTVRTDGKKTRRRTAKWYGWYKDPATGKTVRVPLSEDKAVAQQLLARLVADLEKGRHGLADRYAPHRSRPLAEHAEDHRQDVANRGVTPQHVRLVHTRLCRILALSGMRTTADITPARIQAALAKLKHEGAGITTCNMHLQAVKQFCRWLVREGRLEDNPIAYLKGGNVALDRRHDRRALAPDEASRLLAATTTGREVCRLSGPDRAVLYLVALTTGLRASELASLTPQSFDTAADTPTVTVAAGYSKHRRQDTLPLHPAVVPTLRDWLSHRPAGEPCWPGKWARDKRAGVMLKADLAAAGIPYRDEQGRYADFHALRHTFISTMVASGVNPKDAQTLARHSTITLTMDRYSHVEFREQAAVLSALPPPALPPRLHGACIGDGGNVERAGGVATPGPAQNCGKEGESGEGGIRTRGAVLPARRFSKAVLSTTQPPLPTCESDSPGGPLAAGLNGADAEDGSEFQEFAALWPLLPPAARRELLALARRHAAQPTPGQP